MQNVLPLRWKRELPTRADAPSAPGPVLVDDVDAAVAAPADTSASVHPFPGSAGVRVASIDRIELGSLTSIAVRWALVVTTIGALAVLVVWMLARSSGVVDRTESFMRSIGFRDFHIASSTVVLGAVLVVAGLALTLATFMVLTGAAYNLLATHGRGLRVRLGDGRASTVGVAASPAAPERGADASVRAAGPSDGVGPAA